MDNVNNPVQNNVPGKKEMRAELAEKIAAAIPELSAVLGEKKFHSRIKKAVKLLTGGLHKKEAEKTAKAVKKAKTGKKVKATAPKKAKQAAPKKAAMKKAKAAKKAKAGKKAKAVSN